MALTGRDEAKLQGVVAELHALGGEAVVCAGDVRSRRDAERAVTLAVERFGGLQILVNNAQSSTPGVMFEDMDDATMRLTWESGVMGTIQHMQAAYPHLKAAGGSIINLGSREGLSGGARWGASVEPRFMLLARRWVVKRIFGWMTRWRRLRREYEQRLDVSEALIHIAHGEPAPTSITS